jgi:hypothetical protein
MTAASIDALDAEGLCTEICRINLHCGAQRSPAGYPSLEKMTESCQAICLPAKFKRPAPAETLSARTCLKKLDCDAFSECIFGPLSGTASAPSAPPPGK